MRESVEEHAGLRAVGGLVPVLSADSAVKGILIVSRRRDVHEVLTCAQTSIKLLPTPLVAELLVLLLVHLLDHNASLFLVWAHADGFLRADVEVGEAVLARRQVVPLLVDEALPVEVRLAIHSPVHPVPRLLVERVFLMGSLLLWSHAYFPTVA